METQCNSKKMLDNQKEIGEEGSASGELQDDAGSSELERKWMYPVAAAASGRRMWW